MEKSDQAEIDDPEIDHLCISERNSSSESDSEEIVSGDSECPSHPPINTISTIIGKTIRVLQRNRERILKCKKAQIRVSLFHRIKRGEAVSYEEYINLLRGKFKNTNGNGNFIWEKDNIKFPRDIEIAKESSKYSVEEIKNQYIVISELNENVLECLQNLLRSFAYTQIEQFYLRGYRIRSENKDHDSHIYPCSNFFEELRYAVSRATNRIEIYSLELSSREFIQLVKAAKKVESLKILDCKISFDSVFDFGQMEGCLIKKIEIGYNYQVYDELSEYEEGSMKIFCGILNCTNLIRSLKFLVFDCTDDLKEKMIETAKNKFGEEYSDIMPSLEYD